MVSSEVQRTLVKSPPELWAELSDPEALARHLGELGEIRITRTKPEERVEWEAESTTGTVLIKPSGWGTKVTLSVTRNLEAAIAAAAGEPVVEEPATAQEPAAEQEPVTESPAREEPRAEGEPQDGDLAAAEPRAEEPAATESSAEELNAAEPLAEPPDTDADEPSAEPDVPQEPRRGFFARLFGRRRPKSPETALTSEPADSGPDPQEPLAPEPLAETEPAPLDADEPDLDMDAAAQPSTQAGADPSSPATSAPSVVASHMDEPAVEEAPEPAADTGSEPVADLAAELQQAEEVAAEEVAAVLTAVLDRLGAAHHRPFSRS
jgi:hypothetical protein